jgi:hypothetical protein
MLIYVTDVASWASPRHEHSEAEREKLCARLKLTDAARAATLEMDKPRTDMKQFNIADVAVKIQERIRSDTIGDEGEYEHDSDEPSWLVQLFGIAKRRKQAIGRLHAKLIFRGRIVGSFEEEMEEPSEGTAAMAFELFDRYGRLRPEFIEHPFKKGTGIGGMS